jgi:hypothetical protein
MLKLAEEQFLDIAVKVCPQLKEETSRIIGEEVWIRSKEIHCTHPAYMFGFLMA